MTDPIPTVQQAWLAVMNDVGAIGKSERANAGSYSYQFRGVEKTVNAVQPVLITHGVTVVPIGMTAETYEYTTDKGKREEMARVTTTWLVTGPAGDSFQMQSIGSASDGGDKATIQAVSVAQRVALLVGLQIPTVSGEDDPDHHHPQRVTAEQAAAADEAAKAGGWQDAAQRAAVWEAVLATAQALPQEAHDVVVVPWAKEVKLSPDTLTVDMAEGWRAKIAEAALILGPGHAEQVTEEPPPPSSPAASPQEPAPASSTATSSAPSDFDAETAYADLNEKMRMLPTKDAQRIEAWLEEQKIISPEELTKTLAAEWFAMLSDVLGAAASEPAPAPREWKSKAERKRTFESLLDRQGKLPEMIRNDVIEWGRGAGISMALSHALSEDWLQKIMEAELESEAPFS